MTVRLLTYSSCMGVLLFPISVPPHIMTSPTEAFRLFHTHQMLNSLAKALNSCTCFHIIQVKTGHSGSYLVTVGYKTNSMDKMPLITLIRVDMHMSLLSLRGKKNSIISPFNSMLPIGICYLEREAQFLVS